MSLPRYPEYRDSRVPWLGELPAHWGVSPMKRLLDIQNGADYKHIEAEDGYPVLGSGGQFTFATDYIYDGESVLLGRKGTIDRPLHVKGRFWTVDTMYWSRIRPDVCGRFCYYAATTIPFGLYSTNTALPSMTKAALDAHFLASPPLEEQRSIANLLDRETAKIDALIAEQEKLLALLAEKRQAAISHAVTRGLDPNAPMKDSGIAWLGEVPAHWEITRLGVILDAIGDVDHFMPASVEQGVPYLMTGDLKEFVSEVSLEGCKQVSDEDYLALSRKIKSSKGDVIMARYATIGTSMYVDVDTDFLVSYSCVTLKANHSKVSGLYLFQYMRSDAFRQAVEGQVNTNTQGNVGINHLKNISVVLPPITEQAGIAAFVGSETATIDEMKAEAERAITLLRERRSALIAAAVTGKIDVRGAVEREAS
ncbi:restriction endonuclease subunit S [Lysobacter oculi]|uniref:Restriction endonuclease subunit S n=2 Tax=Solilutibacter oculi TaxID=2698682 RepID=A0A344J8A8_9GAMM|nr:restriction endonuclease subunit S [Lysobacter oculi]